MGLDLSALLADWPFEQGQINVRLIQGDDGDPKLQLRVDLGILQMELTGRPDGLRPQGHESLLDLYTQSLETAPHPHDANPQDDPQTPTLSADDCRLLREEALQYYHRYIALLVLGDYEGVIRDTTRNLRVMDLCKDHAEEDDDRVVLEQFRPYVIMMRTRALASQAVSEGETKAAMLSLDLGLELLANLFEDIGAPEQLDESHEAALLRGMRAELMNKLPASQTSELRERLKSAIAAENYELAAILRDELKMMRDDTPPTRA